MQKCTKCGRGLKTCCQRDCSRCTSGLRCPSHGKDWGHKTGGSLFSSGVSGNAECKKCFAAVDNCSSCRGYVERAARDPGFWTNVSTPRMLLSLVGHPTTSIPIPIPSPSRKFSCSFSPNKKDQDKLAPANPQQAKFAPSWPNLPEGYVTVLAMRWSAARADPEGVPGAARGDEYRDVSDFGARMASSWLMSGLGARTDLIPCPTLSRSSTRWSVVLAPRRRQRESAFERHYARSAGWRRVTRPRGAYEACVMIGGRRASAGRTRNSDSGVVGVG